MNLFLEVETMKVGEIAWEEVGGEENWGYTPGEP